MTESGFSLLWTVSVIPLLTVSDTYYLWSTPIRNSCGYNLVLSLLPALPPSPSLMLIFFGHIFTTELHIISYHEIYSRTYLDKRCTLCAMLWKFTEPQYLNTNVYVLLKNKRKQIIFKNWGEAIQTNGVVCIKHVVLKVSPIAGILRKNSQILSGMHIFIIYTID